MNFYKTVASLAALSLVTACAQQPNQIEASYVSPEIYSGLNCNGLMKESNEIVTRVNALNSEQKKAATTDAVLTGVALVVFWPAAIGLAATKDNAGAVSAAKGNYDAITAKMREKGCQIPEDAIQPTDEVKPVEDRKKRSWE